MSLRYLFVILSVSFVFNAAYAADLNRDFTYSSSDSYVWLFEVGEDFGSDSGAGNTNAVAVRFDDDSSFVRAEVNGLATPSTSSSTVARISGNTMTTSPWSGGYNDGNNDWHMGSLQTFAGSVETNNTVSVAGTLNHHVSFSFTTGADNNGDVNAWAKVGNVQVYFTWTGGNTLYVTEYVNGVVDGTPTIVSFTGQFTYSKNFTQTVQVGDQIEVDSYGALIDNENWTNVSKNLTVLAGTE